MQAHCTGKQKYETFSLANKVANRNHPRRKVYRCNSCHGFHMAEASPNYLKDKFRTKKDTFEHERTKWRRY